MKRKKVAILGSTGSVGRSTLEVLMGEGAEGFSVELLAARSAMREILAQAERFRAPRFYLDNPLARERAEEYLSVHGGKTRPKNLRKSQDLLDYLSSADLDIVVMAFSDFEISVLAMDRILTRSGRPVNVLVASKELMVAFGDYYRELALKNGHRIIPLDSEPSALFQCLGGRLETDGRIDLIYLTASGGPFYRKIQDHRQITPQMALKHPVWKMGQKITVDCATLLNKTLELMEIAALFNFPTERVKILVHPQCVIHSMVAMKCGSILAQLGPADMKIPIHYGLFWPNGFSAASVVRPLDFSKLMSLTFEPPPVSHLPCLKLGLEVAAIKGPAERQTARLALLGADDVAVERFLAGRLDFNHIPDLLRKVVDRSLARLAKDKKKPRNLISQGLEIYHWAREAAATQSSVWSNSEVAA